MGISYFFQCVIFKIRYERVTRRLFVFCFMSAPKEKIYGEAAHKGTPKRSQPWKTYSRKTTTPSPRGGLPKPNKAVPSKNHKIVLYGKLAFFESVCYIPRTQH